MLVLIIFFLLIRVKTEDTIKIIEAESYWQFVLNMKIAGHASEERFLNLDVATAFLFTMPCSTAIAKRLFSTLKLNKTVHSNCLFSEVFSG